MMAGQKTVCVTGGSGFIGSWLVRLLLDGGYTVNATVKNLDDENETKHLQALGSPQHLRLFQIDLLDYDSIAAAIDGVTGVFHLATPIYLDKVDDPEKKQLRPAIDGTMNVLRAAKKFGVERVVITSSCSSIYPNPQWPADVVMNEDCWTDVDYCKQKEMWYSAAKTLAEKAAWEFAKENGLDMVAVLPGAVMGPVLPPNLGPSMSLFLSLLQGNTYTLEDQYMGLVHVKDVAQALILVYETPSATGRYLCLEAISHYGDLASKVAELYPQYQVPSLPKDTQPGLLRSKDGGKKLKDMGLEFASMEQIIKDSVETLKSKGLIS